MLRRNIREKGGGETLSEKLGLMIYQTFLLNAKKKKVDNLGQASSDLPKVQQTRQYHQLSRAPIAPANTPRRN